MICPKCAGFIVYERTAFATYDPYLQPCWKCVNCGYRDDVVYQANRVNQQKEVYHA